MTVHIIQEWADKFLLLVSPLSDSPQSSEYLAVSIALTVIR